MYKIGEFFFNTKLAHVECPNGELYELTSTPFELLKFLVENNDRLVSKRELVLKVWRHEVSDSSINKMISELRTMFGDSAKDSRYIVTRRKLGYRLIAKVESHASMPTETGEAPKLVTHLNNNEAINRHS
ncbi:winged helix-turn-helix domain-containing protein [Pseudoalteromonas phenolica]|uniref:winged helix-turn-helix domain-containing protein n=1 Tax=Pseudoalteromonas phenolica TaxID=161398 RepID=UPI0014875BC3|nr:helix-turn-helix domain-containing protein [Pseudoalteromonas phenolica]